MYIWYTFKTETIVTFYRIIEFRILKRRNMNISFCDKILLDKYSIIQYHNKIECVLVNIFYMAFHIILLFFKI